MKDKPFLFVNFTRFTCFIKFHTKTPDVKIICKQLNILLTLQKLIIYVFRQLFFCNSNPGVNLKTGLACLPGKLTFFNSRLHFKFKSPLSKCKSICDDGDAAAIKYLWDAGEDHCAAVFSKRKDQKKRTPIPSVIIPTPRKNATRTTQALPSSGLNEVIIQVQNSAHFKNPNIN